MKDVLLVHQPTFESCLENMQMAVDSRLELLKSHAGNDIQCGSWWESIKAQGEGGEFQRHGRVAVVPCVGAMSYKYDIWSYLFDSSCYVGISRRVQAAVDDSGIDKIVLYVDSPGGYAVGCPEASDVIYAARESGKEVVAVVDPHAYSGGYWLASQASRIVCLGSGGVGSIGSMVTYMSVFEALKAMGQDVELLRSKISPKKNLGHPLEPLNDDARADMQVRLDYIGDTFVEHVARGRGVSESVVLSKFGKGGVFFGNEAISNGMIDAIGTLADELSVPSANSGRGDSRVERVSIEDLSSSSIY